MCSFSNILITPTVCVSEKESCLAMSFVIQIIIFLTPKIVVDPQSHSGLINDMRSVIFMQSVGVILYLSSRR